MMLNCREIAVELTAYIDEELTASERATVESHCDECEACSAELDSLRASSAQLQSLLAIPADTDVDAMRAAVRNQIAAQTEAPTTSTWLAWLFGPRQAAAALATSLVMIVSLWSLGALDTALISIGVTAPPAEVAQSPDLFYEYDLIRNLDLLKELDESEDRAARWPTGTVMRG